MEISEIVTSTTTVRKPKVAIIGAGVSGLLAARHLKDIADIKVYESREDVGGLWLYSEHSERSHPNLESNAFYNLYGCLQSSLYHNMITNAPKECMTFKDFKHSEDTPYIMHSKTFYNYLKEYAAKFDLMRHIELNRTVTSLKAIKDKENRYRIQHICTNIKEDTEVVEDFFDHVVVCNGHCSVPNMPNFEGTDSFEGTQFHIHQLKKMEPQDFDEKAVLIVGAWISANDLILNLFFREDTKDLVHPKKVYITGRTTELIEKSKDLQELNDMGLLEIKKGNVTRINPNSVEFGDGTEEEIDTIIYSTGYRYSIPFIDPKDKIIEFDTKQKDGYYFGPLYKRMFCINEPNIYFVGLVEKAPLIHYIHERQVFLIKELILGKISLPSKREMLSELEKDLSEHEERDEKLRKFFKFNKKGYSHKEYSSELEQLTTMKVDTINYELLEPAHKAKAELEKSGSIVKIKSFDFSKYLDDIGFNPTSYKF
ncbi:unnamed protein product [Moneuplotes crassus]|uniref:Flavin-containing monooxygenase n=1 Tax=Euplotes crassus TaxID=5936 RepID=A0AAD1XCL7_EUPCR|nr:unnamed protein product [Moneuplotes crassus]